MTCESMIDCDLAWENFLEDETIPIKPKCENVEILKNKEPPKSSELYISTQTKISYINSPIDIFSSFWKIPMISYHEYGEGVIKKQIKFSFTNNEQLTEYKNNLKHENFFRRYFENYVYFHINLSDKLHTMDVWL